MKKLLLFVGLFSVTLSFSQKSEIISNGASSTNMYGGVSVSTGPNKGVWIKSHPSETKVEGSNYLFSSWTNMASIYTADNKGYKIPKVNFNVKFNRFEANLSEGSKDSIFAFNSKSIDKVVLDNHEFVRREVKGKGSNYFLELIQQGDKISLLKSYSADIIPGTVNPMTQQKLKEDTIKINSSYYIDRDGALEEIKLKKSTVLKLMSDKKDELKSFLTENKLSFKEDNDIKKIFGYYNSI